MAFHFSTERPRMQCVPSFVRRLTKPRRQTTTRSVMTTFCQHTPCGGSNGVPLQYRATANAMCAVVCAPLDQATPSDHHTECGDYILSAHSVRWFKWRSTSVPSDRECNVCRRLCAA